MTADRSQVEELARDIAAIELQLGIGEVRGYADALAPFLAALGYQRITPDSIVVPREPTEEMVNAAYEEMRPIFAEDLCEPNPNDWAKAYRAMLAATSPSNEGEEP